MSIQRRGASQTGTQLKMFMTPAEIHEGWQGLDADLAEGNEYGEETARSWEGSKTYSGGSAYTYNTEGDYARRSEGGTRYSPRKETHDEMWGRKLEEASGEETHAGEGKYVAGSQESRWTQTSGGGSEYVPGSGEVTLHESIGKHGVHSPIRLGGQIGSQGKPEIVGGHHRVASATEHANFPQGSGNQTSTGEWSHQFLPVLHYRGGIHEARADKTWPYT